MRNFALACVMIVLRGQSVQAFDPSTMLQSETATVDAFRFGAQAYKNGDKSTAIDALTYAADNGHMASQWKLGRMYADGDGVNRDSGRAFDIFQKIVVSFGDARPGSVEARYVSNAFVKLSEFFRIGIKKKVAPDQGKARDFLYHAASYFRDPDAQYHLGLVYLEQRGGAETSKQAARWLNKAARKGHVMAQLQLGDLLLSGERIPRQPVNGLKWLTVARMLDGGNANVRDRQEAAFALADPETRRIAVSLAEDWVNGSGR
ncbi:MAG: sel1 repeat family protein [Cohaesibacter sp.]|jgi:TPR repeat protein|nr:sel1 repeat family protein [Cohaesibacter sp.]